jgi:hypothetical protein
MPPWSATAAACTVDAHVHVMNVSASRLDTECDDTPRGRCRKTVMRGRANPVAPPSYYAVSNSGGGLGGLSGVLGTIASGLIMSCRLQLGSLPETLDQLNVEVDGVPIPQQGADGWFLDMSTDPPTIELKGATCDGVEREGASSVRVVYGCPTIVE